MRLERRLPVSDPFRAFFLSSSVAGQAHLNARERERILRFIFQSEYIFFIRLRKEMEEGGKGRRNASSLKCWREALWSSEFFNTQRKYLNKIKGDGKSSGFSRFGVKISHQLTWNISKLWNHGSELWCSRAGGLLSACLAYSRVQPSCAPWSPAASVEILEKVKGPRWVNIADGIITYWFLNYLSVRERGKGEKCISSYFFVCFRVLTFSIKVKCPGFIPSSRGLM